MGPPAHRTEVERQPAAQAARSQVTAPQPPEHVSFDPGGGFEPAQLLALQRSAGNAAVSGLVGRGSQPPAVQRQPQATKAAPPPRVASWGTRLTKGALGAGEERTFDAAGNQTVFVGDRVTVTASFASRLSDDQKQSISFIDMHLGDSSVCSVQGGTWQGNALTWEVTFQKAGPLTTTFSLSSADTGVSLESGAHNETFTVVTDLVDFIMSVQAAQSQLLARFAAVLSRLYAAAQAYREAHADQDAALKDVGAQEKMVDDLLWGALFAGVGGAAGGAVGGALKKTFEDWKLSAAATGALTDAAKDVTKFAVRSADRIRAAGHGGVTAVAGDSTSPTVPTTKPGGERSASGDNPLDFLTGSAGRIENDRVLVQNALTRVIEDARHARAANTKADFDEDPLEVASRKSGLDQVASDLNTEKKYYLKGLWQTWLGAYGYKLHEYIARGTGPHATVEDNVSGKLRTAIRKAAEQCGEDGDTWIQQFSEPLRQQLEAEASEINAPHL